MKCVDPGSVGGPAVRLKELSKKDLVAGGAAAEQGKEFFWSLEQQ